MMAASDTAPDDIELEPWRSQQAALAQQSPLLANLAEPWRSQQTALAPAAVPEPMPPVDIQPPPPAIRPQPAPITPPAAPSKPILDTTSTTQTSEKLSKVQQEDFAQLDKIKTDEQSAQKRLAADKVKDAEVEREAADAQQVSAEAAQQQRAQAIEEAQRRRHAAEVEYANKLDAFNKQDFHSFFSSRPASAEVLADVGVALGAFGAAGRGQNEALQILNSRVEQDFNEQRARIEKAKDSVIMAKTGIQDADEARKVALQDLDIKQAAALQAIQARLVAGKAQQYGSTAAAQGDKDVAAIAKDIQERKERTTAGMATRTSSTQSFVNPDALEAKAGARKNGAQDLSIYDPDTGNYLGTGRSARDVSAATKTLESAQKARQSVLALQAFHEAHPGRQWGAFGVGTPEYTELQGLRKDAVNAFASLYGNGGSDLKMKGDAFRLPKEGDLFAGQEHEAQISHLLETVDAVKSGVLRARGIEPPADAAKPPVVNPAGQPAPVVITPQKRSQMKALLAKYPNDPRADEARALLGM